MENHPPHYKQLIIGNVIDQPSTNTAQALLKELSDLRTKDPQAKTLVFSSFAPSLAWLAGRLKENGFQFATLTGSMTLPQRAGARGAAATGACPLLALEFACPMAAAQRG